MKAILVAAAILLTANVSVASPWHGYSNGHGSGWRPRYVPSAYMEYNQALDLGKQQLAELAEQPKSLGEIAREYRGRKAHSKQPATENAQPHTASPPAKDATPPPCPPSN